MEPYGRIGIGILELFTAIFLLIPNLVWPGSLLSTGIISDAIFMHLTIIGIETNNDGDFFILYRTDSLYLKCFPSNKCAEKHFNNWSQTLTCV